MTSYQRRFLRIRVTHSRSCYHRLVGTKRVTQGLGPEKIIKYALLKSEVRTPLPTLLYRLHSDGTSPHHAFLPPSLSVASVPTPLRRPPAAGRPFSSVGYRHPSRLFLHLHQSSSPAAISLFLLQIWMEPPPLCGTGRGCSRRCRRWWRRAGQAGFPTAAAHVAPARIGDGVQPLQSRRPTATARGLPCTGVGENPPTPLPFPAAPSAQAGSPRPLTRSTFFEPYCVFSARLAGVRRNASKTT